MLLDDQQQDQKEKEKEEEELVFTACQILSGNLNLDQGRGRGRAILDLLDAYPYYSEVDFDDAEDDAEDHENHANKSKSKRSSDDDTPSHHPSWHNNNNNNNNIMHMAKKRKRTEKPLLLLGKVRVHHDGVVIEEQQHDGILEGGGGGEERPLLVEQQEEVLVMKWHMDQVETIMGQLDEELHGQQEKCNTNTNTGSSSTTTTTTTTSSKNRQLSILMTRSITNHKRQKQKQKQKQKKSSTPSTELLPVMLIPTWKLLRNAIRSIALVDMANDLIEQTLQHGAGDGRQQEIHNEAPQILHYAFSALQCWPCNASAWIMLANVQRMLGGKLQNNNNLEVALQCYRVAAKCAFVAHKIARTVLDNSHDDDDDSNNNNNSTNNDDKFLIEAVLCRSVQESDNGGDDDDDDDDDAGKSTSSTAFSQVLVTSSYMSAMLASSLGHHELAAKALRRFDGSGKNNKNTTITRIHPHVWKAATQETIPIPSHNKKKQQNSYCGPSSRQQQQQQQQQQQVPVSQGTFCPRVFPNTTPNDLFQTLRHAFRPDAPYWEQTMYNRNVYYSFWTDWNPTSTTKQKEGGGDSPMEIVVSNAVEHYIVAHLLPRFWSVMASSSEASSSVSLLAGFEWWVHTRPSHGANIGHQLHFDTDEALLDQDKDLRFPMAASVTYLTEPEQDNEYGATVLFDQTPFSKDDAATAWINKPQSKSLLVFPGNLLHGVLPCVPSKNSADNRSTTCTTNDKKNNEDHRLTFMVNFWAYRIPDNIKKRKLYGPSGPWPPPTRKHSWMKDITDGYPRVITVAPTTDESSSGHSFVPSNESSLTAVSPAWEKVPKEGVSADNTHDVWDVPPEECSLELPSSDGGINQRFFVANAPDYFHSTLFES